MADLFDPQRNSANPTSENSDNNAGGSNSPELSVSELSNRLKRTVEDAYSFVRVRGEMGRVTLAKSGHLYVDLKDDKAVLNTIMWKGQVSKLPFKPEEGLEVIAEGRLSTYPGRSNYQMIAESMRPAGVGALMQLLEERKKKLAAEGLFNPEHKKDLPFIPETIGVVTSPTGAVIRDILHRVKERFPTHVVIWPALVQGEYAAEQVAGGVRGFNAISPNSRKYKRPDLIIVARGGGSVEDLWPFNDEAIVRAVFESEIPVISAVGHETDTTLIDFVSDRRAPTPTGAAEIALPVRAELIATNDALGARNLRALQRGLEGNRVELKAVAARLPRADSLVQNARQRLDFAGEKLGFALKDVAARLRSRFQKAAGGLQPIALQRELLRRQTAVETLGSRAKFALRRDVSDRSQRLHGVYGRFLARDPRNTLGRRQILIENAFNRATVAVERVIRKKHDNLESINRLLSSVSHENVLARGFVLVQRMNGELVRHASDVTSAERLRLQFIDDEVRVTSDTKAPAEVPRIVGRDAEPQQPVKLGGITSAPPKKVIKPPPSDGGQGDLF
ncbi:exodeoxyribonuclease VII large subunit [Hirschia maritima]|uniref:exodeoxyribonuclease VII large subunit n=1 Tax=Hirschia maritima TaxID=1121961 RepID=UPI0003740F03|nr:exodeoxyribonuclease VII large subunit [Hirschia maritima]